MIINTLRLKNGAFSSPLPKKARKGNFILELKKSRVVFNFNGFSIFAARFENLPQTKNFYMMTQNLGTAKVIDAQKAVQLIKSGDRVVFGHAAAEPQVIPIEMIAQKDRLHNVQIFYLYSLNKGELLQPELKDHFTLVTTFITTGSRAAMEDKRVEFLPCFFHQSPYLFDEIFPPDVAVVSVSQPDEKGYCSFGPSSDYTTRAARKAKIVIAEMNDKMPYVGGDNFIHVNELDYIVHTSKPLYNLPPIKSSELDEIIGGYCASLVHDGDTIQMGVGNIPHAILHLLEQKNDLGLHTEMFSDGIIPLVEKGVFNGSRKTMHKGKLVATFIMGSQNLYDWIDHNPLVEAWPVNHVNDPRVIAQHDNFVSINSCLEVDMYGQVAAESIGSKQVSGVGGQVDFLRGVAFSKGGRSILAMPSTAAKGTISRIKPFLTPGTAVTTSRNDVDYIVTEYGIAHLRTMTLRQRAKALIEIAHPDFRDELIAEYNRRF